MAEVPPKEQGGGIGAALSGALGTVQRLLAGREGRGRWKELAVLAAMAGVAGVGVQPPPLGLLQPLLDDPLLRAQLGESLRPAAPLIGLLLLVLLGMAPVARAFTLAFVSGVFSGAPAGREWRRWLGPGVAHFVWSSALTLPLYALLFAGEWAVAGHGWDRLLEAPGEQVAGILVETVLKFFLVLFPWALLTLPAMVVMYELTPAAMVLEGKGPLAACGRVLAAAGGRPGPFALYMGVRVLLQFLGTTLGLLAMVPAFLLSLLPGVPLLALGWGLAGALGGPGTGPGAAAVSVGTLLWLVVLYVLTCAALVPLSAFLFALAGRVLSPSSGAGAETTAG